MHHGTAYEHRSLQGVVPFVGMPGHRRQQTIVRGQGLATGIHQHETSGAVSVLCHPRRKAGLAEKSSVLITRNARERDFPPFNQGESLAPGHRGRHDPRQHGRWNAK